MKRITQSLFEEIQKVTSNQIEEKKHLKHDEDKDGDEDAADYMMKRRKAGGQSHAQSHAATRKHNEEVEVQDTADTPIEEVSKPEVDHHFDQWMSSEHAPYHGDAGDDPKIHRSAMSYLKSSSVPKKDHEKLAMHIADKFHGSGIGEGISETIIKHNDFVLEITNNPTFADFLNAAKSFVDSEEEAVAVAEAFYAEQDDSIIIEAFTRADIDAKVAAHQKAGHTVSMPKFSTKGGEPYAEYVVSDKETKVRRKYIHHGTARRVENMGTPGKKDKGEK